MLNFHEMERGWRFLEKIFKVTLLERPSENHVELPKNYKRMVISFETCVRKQSKSGSSLSHLTTHASDSSKQTKQIRASKANSP